MNWNRTRATPGFSVEALLRLLMVRNSVSLAVWFIIFPSRRPTCFTKSVYGFNRIENTDPFEPYADRIR